MWLTNVWSDLIWSDLYCAMTLRRCLRFASRQDFSCCRRHRLYSTLMARVWSSFSNLPYSPMRNFMWLICTPGSVCGWANNSSNASAHTLPFSCCRLLPKRSEGVLSANQFCDGGVLPILWILAVHVRWPRFVRVCTVKVVDNCKGYR